MQRPRLRKELDIPEGRADGQRDGYSEKGERRHEVRGWVLYRISQAVAKSSLAGESLLNCNSEHDISMGIT